MELKKTLLTFSRESTLRMLSKSTEWAIKNYELWLASRDKKFPQDKCPTDILSSKKRGKLCEWLCKFVSEIQKANGTEYTPRRCYLL